MTLEEMSQVILSITADPKLTSFVRQKQQQKTTAKRERGRGGGRRGGGREGRKRKNRNRNRISPKYERYICVTSISQTR
jgi:hypothetical protein